MAEDARELLSFLGALARAEHRPWSEFFHEFRLPSKFEPNLVKKRVLTNVLYYRENYAEIFGVFLCVAMLWRRSLILVVAGVAAFVFYLFRTRRVPVVVGSRVVTRHEKAAAAVFLALLFIWFSGNLIFVALLILMTGKCKLFNFIEENERVPS